MTPNILLASSSNSRKQLLSRILKQFECFSPDIDESSILGESPLTLAKRLSLQKAERAAQDFPQHLIIAGDQTAVCEGVLLGKPGTAEKAEAQLQLCQGKAVQFYSGICLYNAITQHYQLDIVPFEVIFRVLSHAEIHAYVQADQPLYSAGSFKFESLGISLFSKTSGDDSNALIGLPLIRLTDFLRNEGINPLLG